MSKLKNSFYPLSLFLLCMSSNSFASPPVFLVDGVSGTNTLGRADILLPLIENDHSMFFTDFQGKYQIKDRDWFTGAGMGYRCLKQNFVQGGYLFVDYNESAHRHPYYVANPGFEWLYACYDFHINAYIPFKQRFDEGSFFPSDLNGDPDFIEFQGHQQLEHLFIRKEEVGPGADLSAGIVLPSGLWGSALFLKGGAYYYHLHDKNDIIGASSSAEVPLRNNISFVLDAGYDNNNHGAVVAGLRYRFGNPHRPGCLCDRMYEPVYRNISTVDQGTSLPVGQTTRDKGLVVRRDDIYFFSENGLAVFGDTNAGTFENPFSKTQFTPATVDSIQIANFYFAPGTYQINSSPNGIVTLGANQSVFGRSDDFKLSAVGDSRPVLEGRINIVGGNHTLESIQLVNSHTITAGGQTLEGLSITNANVNLFNDVVDVFANFGGDFPATPVATRNAALAIVANGSNVVIDNSVINATSMISGNNLILGSNVASALGNVDASFSDNNFLITNSLIQARADVEGSNAFFSSAAAIGNQANAINNVVTADFANNEFIISNSRLSSFSNVVGDASGTTVAAGIGNNSLTRSTGITTVATNTANFENNLFNIGCSTIESGIAIGGTNSGISHNSGIGNNNTTTATAGTATSTSNFIDNVFNISHTTIATDQAIVGTSTFTQISGIGNNLDSLSNVSAGTTAQSATATFADNFFNVVGSSITAQSNIGVNDTFIEMSGIGNNVLMSTTPADTPTVTTHGDFVANTFVVRDSAISLENIIIGDNGTTNLLTGIGNNIAANNINAAATTTLTADFIDNQFTVNCSTIDVLFNVGTGNGGRSVANGIGNALSVPGPNPLTTFSGGFINNTFNLQHDFINVDALVSGANTAAGINLAFGIDASDGGAAASTINVSDSVINVVAKVQGNNTGANTATGLRAVVNSVIHILDSELNVAASGNGNTTVVPTVGNVIAENTIFN